MTDDPKDRDQEHDEPKAGSGEAKRAMPEGIRVVRKGRGGGGGRRAGSRKTVFLKKREISRDAHEPVDRPVEAEVQGQRGEEAPPEEAVPLEDRWGSRQERKRGARLIMIAVFALVIPLIAILVGFSLLRGPKAEQSGPGGTSGLNLDEVKPEDLHYDAASPLAWFYENSVQAFEDAVAVLQTLGDGSVIPPGVLIDEKRVGSLARKHGLGDKSPYFLSDPRSIWWELGSSGDKGFIALYGRRENLVPFRAYLVHTEKGIQLDWEATVAWSEVPVTELVEKAPKSPVLVRGWVGKQPHFDAVSGRSGLVSWYQVLDANKENFVWGYVPAESKLDLELKALMNYGLVILDRKDEVRATIRLKKPSSGVRDTEFEIVELVASDWVLP
ncbi:MAG: hypothetical protein HKO57_02175 [Akkermansiaceae bacterium]|nr:hypothetical protein [Akkermansiaceae bacterium]